MLHHAQRQLLSRCSRRYYSVNAVSGDAVAASGASVPRTRRPSASSFGGISIQNVAVPSQSQGSRSRPNRPSRAAMSDWGDGLVTFSFSNRLKMHQKRLTRPDTAARPEGQERRQQSQRSTQMQGRQQEQGTGSRAPRSRDAHDSSSAAHTRRPTSADARPRTTSMTTRSPTSRLNNHAQPTSPSTTAPSDATEVPAPTNAAAPAVRAARLTALSSTNLNALFRTRDTPVAGTPLPVYASMTARVRSVLERSAGDYSRFLPRTVGVRKSASTPPALRTARHALAAQRDVSLAQRRVALHIIGGLAQPGRQVSA
ncbi:hypothetical protein EDB92DRAFT_1851745 [Lactarius akahatsu]|uniref:Uncharacterized protein n=1 Tax=Lactarius akahatsu TaxID=416441 RepID=A0AAD4LJ12_9AGAM|nr:hypothetical protein EDB92DRAFT_1851745 [Lactarius akahatsu]